MNKKDARTRRASKTRLRIAEQRATRLVVSRSNCHIYAQIVAQEKALASGGDVAVPTTDKTPLSVKRRRWNPEKGAFE